MSKYFQAPWKNKDFIIIFASVIGLAIFMVIIAQLLNLSQYIEASSNRSLLIIIGFLLQWAILMIPLLVITQRKYNITKETFGFKKIGKFRTLGWATAGYFLYLGITFAITLIIINLDIKIPGFEVQERILPQFGETTIDLIIAGIIIVGIAPVLEEIFFRGFVLRSLVNKIGGLYGNILTALVFALFHLQLQTFIPLFIIGLIINSLVIRSKSIWPAIVFHVINNSIAFLVEILILKDYINLDTVI